MKNAVFEYNQKVNHPLQSWEWGEFRKEWGNVVLREKNYQIIFSRIPKTNLTIGTLIRGPKLKKEDLKKIKDIAQKQKAIFVKIEPNITFKNKREAQETIKALRDFGCKKGKHLFTPQTFWIDLTKNEDDLIASFHPKTRYNIRYAQRKGVVVKEDNSKEAFEKYLELTFQTAKRQNFYAHSKKYHQLMWKHLHNLPKKNGNPPIAHLLTAKYKDKIVVTWIVFTFKNFLYYPYGASDYRYHKLMASNLMMWEAVKFGKKMGLKTFDLWGKEEGKGFTRFKEGYNPEVVEFVGSWDLIINKPLYYIYQIVDKIRWIILKKIIPAFR
ncbi:MAG: peptidoglycan bridge formation protein FemAB [Patescibacteria group bacterium]|nr:MAG: peptidoglycan bridge formation protein FemAB [Patescibacteria group bacterium]